MVGKVAGILADRIPLKDKVEVEKMRIGETEVTMGRKMIGVILETIKERALIGKGQMRMISIIQKIAGPEMTISRGNREIDIAKTVAGKEGSMGTDAKMHAVTDMMMEGEISRVDRILINRKVRGMMGKREGKIILGARGIQGAKTDMQIDFHEIMSSEKMVESMTAMMIMEERRIHRLEEEDFFIFQCLSNNSKISLRHSK